MTMGEVMALAAVGIPIGTNLALYLHLSRAMNARFDSVDRRLEMLTGLIDRIDAHLTKLER